MRKVGKIVINPYTLSNKYYSKPSDDFLEQDARGLFTKNKIDIALVDGMHGYEYALRDVENILNYLSDGGVIIIHNCNPATKVAARTFEE